MKKHRGTLILVLGILSLFLCGLFTAIPAWIMGRNDLKEMDSGIMDPSGRGLTNAGRIIGIIVTILSILAFIVVIALFALGMLAPSAVPQQ